MHQPSEATNAPLLLNLKTTATVLGLSEFQVRGLIRDDRLPAEKIGKGWFIPAESVHEYAARIARGEA